MRKLAALPVLFCTFAFASVKIQTLSLPNGAVGTSYSASIQAPGGTLPYTWWVQSGALPSGLTLVACTKPCANIQGMPTTAGTFNFAIEVRGRGGMTSTASYAVTIAGNNPPATLSITTRSLANGAFGVPYSAALAATGGVAPYSWSLSSGILPTGFILSASGVISGTPTVPPFGTFSFTVTVTDSASPQQCASAALSLSINTPVAITTASLPSGVVSDAYSATLTASGGTAPYTWQVSGPLPAGLILSGATLSGTPTVAGTFPFSITASDSSSPVQTASQAFSIVVAAQSHYVTLTWSTVSGAASYSVYRGMTSGGPYTQITGGISPAAYTDDDVAAGGTYYYVVTDMSNTGQESGYSNEAQAIIP
jgi:Putative Ig domain